MRTTLSLSDELLAEARQRAALENTTVSAVVEAAVVESFARHKLRQRDRVRVTLPVFEPTIPGTQPGIDLNNSAQLLAIMEGEE